MDLLQVGLDHLLAASSKVLSLHSPRLTCAWNLIVSRYGEGLVGAQMKVALEIEAEILSSATDHVVRTVTEDNQTLKFASQGFEKE